MQYCGEDAGDRGWGDAPPPIPGNLYFKCVNPNIVKTKNV